MKKIITSSILLCVLFLTGCVKNELTTLSGTFIEFDAASWNANAVGVTYPILTRVPIANAATPSSQPTITRLTGSLNLRVNLVGPQRATATEFEYEVVAGESTAVAGKHYTAFTGKGTIPANSSFATITVTILNPGASTGSVDLVLQLLTNANLKPSINYAKTGLRISQL